MTMPWNQMNDNDKNLTSTLFEALDAIDHLEGRNGNVKKSSVSVGFSDLFDYANDPTGIMSAELGAALIGNANLRADLDRLIARLAVYEFPKAAAASSGDLDSREGDGFKISIKSSRANTDQLYVIVDVTNLSEIQPEAMLLKYSDGRYFKEALPDSVNGKFQLLLDANSEFVKALRDIKAEVFLL